MEREIQVRLCVAAERMGTGLLRTGAALERIATAFEKSPAIKQHEDPATTIRYLGGRS